MNYVESTTITCKQLFARHHKADIKAQKLRYKYTTLKDELHRVDLFIGELRRICREYKKVDQSTYTTFHRSLITYIERRKELHILIASFKKQQHCMTNLANQYLMAYRAVRDNYLKTNTDYKFDNSVCKLRVYKDGLVVCIGEKHFTF